MNARGIGTVARAVDAQAAVRQRTNVYLSVLLDEKIAAADQMSKRYGDLWRALRQLVEAGGKRLRPAMVHLAYVAYGGSNETEAPLVAGCAVELLHTALLVHDDIIDRDTLRYGIKNVTGQYLDSYATDIGDEREKRHFAEGAALLAGDLLLAEAHRLIASITGVTPAAREAATACFAEAVFAVCGGELVDTESAFLDTQVPALVMNEYKTASYSFVGPLLVGASLAGATAVQLDGLRQFARPFGVAYQLQDDLLGVFGDQATTGKSTIGDIREGKRTFMVEQFKRLATEEQKAVFYQVFGVGGHNDDEYGLAADMLAASGAKAACEAKIDELAAAATEQVDTLDISPEHRVAFHELADRWLKRES